MPPAGEQVFKHVSLWGVFHFQTITPTKFHLLATSNPRKNGFTLSQHDLFLYISGGWQGTQNVHKLGRHSNQIPVCFIRWYDYVPKTTIRKGRITCHRTVEITHSKQQKVMFLSSREGKNSINCHIIFLSGMLNDWKWVSYNRPHMLSNETQSQDVFPNAPDLQT